MKAPEYLTCWISCDPVQALKDNWNTIQRMERPGNMKKNKNVLRTPEEIAKKIFKEWNIFDKISEGRIIEDITKAIKEAENRGYEERCWQDKHEYQPIATAIQTARNEGFHKGIDAQLKPVVILPKKMNPSAYATIVRRPFAIRSEGWNGALEELKRLNPDTRFE